MLGERSRVNSGMRIVGRVLTLVLLFLGIRSFQQANMSQWGGSIFSSENMGVILQLDVPVKVGGQLSGNINCFQ